MNIFPSIDHALINNPSFRFFLACFKSSHLNEVTFSLRKILSDAARVAVVAKGNKSGTRTFLNLVLALYKFDLMTL